MPKLIDPKCSKELNDDELEKVSGGDGDGSGSETKTYSVSIGTRIWASSNHNLYYKSNQTKTFFGNVPGYVNCDYIQCNYGKPDSVVTTIKSQENTYYSKLAQCIDDYGFVD